MKMNVLLILVIQQLVVNIIQCLATIKMLAQMIVVSLHLDVLIPQLIVMMVMLVPLTLAHQPLVVVISLSPLKTVMMTICVLEIGVILKMVVNTKN